MPVDPRLGPRLDARPGALEPWSVLQPPAEALVNGEGSRIRSLAVMARALGRSARLESTIELAAEEALRALDAACVSVSRLEPGTGDVRTIINVGLLGPGEARWPVDEVYRLEDYPNLTRVVEDLRGWYATVDDPDADAAEVELMRRYGKGSALAAPVLVDGALWGELYATRLVGSRRSSTTTSRTPRRCPPSWPGPSRAPCARRRWSGSPTATRSPACRTAARSTRPRAGSCPGRP
jgi:hypothetical protein